MERPSSTSRKRHTEPFFTVPKGALAAIRDNVEGTDQAFCSAVYVALRWKANDGFNPDAAFPAAIGDIAQRAGCSYRKTAQSLEVLEAIGVIAIARQYCEGTKTRAPSFYSFRTIGLTPLLPLSVTPCAQNEGSPVPRLDKEQKDDPKEVSNPADSPTLAPIEPPEPESDRAVEIYEAFPRKVARPMALRAIAKALKQTSFDELLAKTKAYAAAVARWPADDAQRFTPHPATWFNGERFHDDPKTWERTGAPSRFGSQPPMR